MEEKIDNAILVLCDKINPATQPDQALKFTQAALNLAHVRQLYNNEKKRAGS